jgi:hypothetical protein
LRQADPRKVDGETDRDGWIFHGLDAAVAGHDAASAPEAGAGFVVPEQGQ